MNSRADPQIDSLRVPPHSIESEQSVLGGLLLDNAAWDRIADFVSADDFYRYDHRLIFQHIVKLINNSRPADVITVFESLTGTGKAEEVAKWQDDEYVRAIARERFYYVRPGEVPLERLKHAIPSFPTRSEIWLQLEP